MTYFISPTAAPAFNEILSDGCINQISVFNISYLKMCSVESSCCNDLTIGWQNLNLLSHPNATLAPQARQAKASSENLNYMTLAPQGRQARPSGEILNYLLSH